MTGSIYSPEVERTIAAMPNTEGAAWLLDEPEIRRRFVPKGKDRAAPQVDRSFPFGDLTR
jgi:hypothetical protein